MPQDRRTDSFAKSLLFGKYKNQDMVVDSNKYDRMNCCGQMESESKSVG